MASVEVWSLAESCGLSAWSGGVARCETLLLDEPTTYLDVTHQFGVLELLRELNRAQARTIVMVLHDLNQAARYAHRMLAVRDGRLVAEGAPDEVVTEQMVRHVFGLDARIIEDRVAGTRCACRSAPGSRPTRRSVPDLLGCPNVRRVPLEERDDFPRAGFRARRWERFEGDLRAWLATPEGRFASWWARRQVALAQADLKLGSPRRAR